MFSASTESADLVTVTDYIGQESQVCPIVTIPNSALLAFLGLGHEPHALSGAIGMDGLTAFVRFAGF
jgi:hypothetical protein